MERREDMGVRRGALDMTALSRARIKVHRSIRRLASLFAGWHGFNDLCGYHSQMERREDMGVRRGGRYILLNNNGMTHPEAI
jgi:hypothetical protein